MHSFALTGWSVGQRARLAAQEGGGDRVGLYKEAAAAQVVLRNLELLILRQPLTLPLQVVLRNSEYGDGDGTGFGMATNLHLDFQVGGRTGVSTSGCCHAPWSE